MNKTAYIQGYMEKISLSAGSLNRYEKIYIKLVNKLLNPPVKVYSEFLDRINRAAGKSSSPRLLKFHKFMMGE